MIAIERIPENSREKFSKILSLINFSLNVLSLLYTVVIRFHSYCYNVLAVVTSSLNQMSEDFKKKYFIHYMCVDCFRFWRCFIPVKNKLIRKN